MDPLVGRTLDNKYLIEKLLGKGGMGSVYQAIHTGTKRIVAVKVIAPQFMRNRELLIRFQREAEASGRLRHPNVVNVTDFGVTVIDVTSVAYLVMEYLDGETLFDRLQRQPILPPTMTVDILEQISLGVTEAHSHGILHRDLKPQNIWLQPDGRGGLIVKVLDFGIAKLADPSSLSMELPELEAAPNVEPNPQDENATQVLAPTELGLTSAFAEASGFTTTVGATLGTPAFMSPEQCSGQAVSEKSDLYSLAMLSYMMLAGELPFKGNARELIEQQILAEPDPPHTRNPRLSEIVSTVVLESLSKDPALRAPDCMSFVSRVRAAVEGEVSLLKESRQMSGGSSGVWFAILAMAATPAGIALSLVRLGTHYAVDSGFLNEWVAFVLVLSIHVIIAYFAMVWADIAMTNWVIHTKKQEGTTAGWFQEMWKAWKALPTAIGAAVFTMHPVVYGLGHVVAAVEGTGRRASQERSKLLLKGSEHLMFAMLVRRVSVAALVALYLPVTMVLVQAPLRLILRETVSGGFGGFLSFASFSFMPIYGSFLLAWEMLYERTKRAIGETDGTFRRKYDEHRGKVGERVRMGTKLWATMPLLLSVVLVLAPSLGWNERFGDTLPLAVREGRARDIEDFLKKGADPNQGRGPGGDPLLVAVQNGDEASAKMLIQYGAQIDAPTKNAGALHYAVLRRRPAMVKLLLDAGAKVNLHDDRDNTALILAAKSGQIEIVKMLLERNATRDDKDSHQRTALDWARVQGNTEIEKLLEAR